MMKKFLKTVVALVISAGILISIENAWGQPFEEDIITTKVQELTSSLNPLVAPTFSAGARIKASGVDMRVDTYASVPCVVDWNEDGKKDLLVGCFYYGNVYLYLNSGTNSSPVFTTGNKLKADGIDISVSYG